MKFSKDIHRFKKGTAMISYNKATGETEFSITNYCDIDELENLYTVLGNLIKYMYNE